MIAHVSHAPRLGAEVHLVDLVELASPPVVAASDVSPELLRLGAHAPDPAGGGAHLVTSTPPPLETLREVERIGSHLGRLERALDALPHAERAVLGERLARIRVLVDCASALRELRESVLVHLRTASRA